MRQKYWAVLLILVFCSASCGYGFRGSESALPPDVTQVYIPLIKNLSSEPGLEITLTEALRDEFERYGVLTVVDKRNQADAILQGSILSVKQETSTTTSNTDTALQLATVLRISAELRRTTGELLWKNEDLSASKVFGAESGVVVTSSAEFASGGLGASDLASLDSREVSRGQQQQALEDLSEDIAQKIYTVAVLPDF